jgi:hypothetical protein
MSLPQLTFASIKARPVVLKLKDIPLTVVAILGIAMMLVDLWQSLRAKDD